MHIRDLRSSNIVGRKVIWCVVFCTLAVALYYIPLPFAAYPETAEDMRLYLESFKITALGTMPVYTAILWACLFQFSRGKRASAESVLDPLGRTALLFLVPISVLWSLQYANQFEFYRSSNELEFFRPSNEWANILIPAASLTGAVFLQIYLATLIDSRFKGWGFWILSAALSVSYGWFGVSDWYGKYLAGAATGRDLYLMGFQTLLCMALAVFAVLTCRKQNRFDEKNLFLLALCIVVAFYWMKALTASLSQNSEQFAYFTVQNGQLLEIGAFSGFVLIFAALFLAGAQKRSDLRLLASALAVVAMCGLDGFSLAGTFTPLMYPHDTLAIAAFSTWLYSEKFGNQPLSLRKTR